MYLAIDIGGTKTLIAAFNHRGKVIKKHRFKTPGNKKTFLAVLEAALIPFSVRHRSKIEQVIIAIPGIIEDNIAVKFGNRPWKNLDLEKQLGHLFDCKITLENDANLATVFETSKRKGLGLYLTFSTGIGGGLARKGQLAKNSGSVEPGHTTYIFDNKSLEWEDIASCAAIGAVYDRQATSVRGESAYEDIALRVALGLPEVIQKYHPDYIVIGGPLAKLFHHFKADLRKDLKNLLPNKSLPRIVPARRPKESVIYGCYLFAKARAKKAKKSQKTRAKTNIKSWDDTKKSRQLAAENARKAAKENARLEKQKLKEEMKVMKEKAKARAKQAKQAKKASRSQASKKESRGRK